MCNAQHTSHYGYVLTHTCHSRVNHNYKTIGQKLTRALESGLAGSQKPQPGKKCLPQKTLKVSVTDYLDSSISWKWMCEYFRCLCPQL